MNIIIFILLFVAVALLGVMIATMQTQNSKLTSLTEANSGRIAEVDARLKEFKKATHTEVQKMWADQDSTILKLEAIAEDIKRLDNLEKTEEDTRQNLLVVAEQVKKNKANIEQNTHDLREIESYYVNYCSRKDKNNV